jgi:transcriptional regulator with XRE-family HTH domain
MVQRNIKHYREKLFPGKGSGNRLAAAVGVSPQLLSQWMNGMRHPSTDKLCALAKVFNISIQELCGMPKSKSINPKLAALDIVMMLTKHQKNCRINKIRAKKINRDFSDIKSFIEREIGG